jgi:hypothetical protein
MATYQLELVLFQQTSPVDTGSFGLSPLLCPFFLFEIGS